MRGKSVADVLGLTVDAACEFFADQPQLQRSLHVLHDVGLGYLRLGQPVAKCRKSQTAAYLARALIGAPASNDTRVRKDTQAANGKVS